MAGDIYVSFGADTAELESAFALAKAETNALAREMASLAREMQATGAAMDSELGARLNATAQKLAIAKGEVSSLKAEMRGGGEGGEGGGFLGGITEKLSGALAPIAALKASLGEIVEVVAAAFAVEKIVEFAHEMGELGEQTERTAKILGITTEQVGRLNFEAAVSGSSTDNLALTMGRFEVGLAQATTGTGKMAAGLKALGLSARDLQGLNVDQQLDKISEAVSKFGDGPGKLAAVEALGRGFVELIPTLDLGAEGFEHLRKVAEETNSILDETTTARLVDMEHGFVTLGAAIKADGVEAFKPFISVMNGASKILTDLAEAFSSSVKEGGLLAGALDLLSLALKLFETQAALGKQILADLITIGEHGTIALAEYFLGLGKTIAEMFKALAAGLPGFFSALVAAGREAVHAVGQAFSDLGTVIHDTLTLDFSGAKAAFGNLGGDAEASLGKIRDAFSGVFDFSKAEASAHESNERIFGEFEKGWEQILANAKTAKSEYQAIWSTDPPKEEKAPGPQVPNLDLGAGDAAKQAAAQVKQTFDEELQSAQDAQRGIADTLNNELKLHQITMSQWLKQSDDALDAEALAVIDAADKALASFALTSQQKQAIMQKEAHALAEIAKQESDDQAKAAEDSLKAWKSFNDDITEAFTSQVDGLLKGTTSFATAFKNAIATLTEEVIKFSVKWALQHALTIAENIAGFNGQVASHVAGNTIMTASDATASAASDVGWIGSALKAISADAGQVMAGVSAFLAPILGPAAVPAGAAAGAAVVSTASHLVTAATGSWALPSDVLVAAHAGEMIVPAAATPWAQALMSNAAGAPGAAGGPSAGASGPNVHFNFGTVIGTQAWINSMMPQFLRAMKTYQSINPSMA